MLHTVVQQHAEEAPMLRQARAGLVRAPHVGLELLGRHDARIEAHLDGLLVAGAVGKEMAQRQLLEDEGESGASFAAAVLALHQGDRRWLDELLTASAGTAASRRGVISAFGWVAPETLRGVVQPLLHGSEPWLRRVGIEACRMHQVDPGASLAAALASTDAPLRAAAWRCAGELGRTDLLDAARAALADGPPEAVFWAAWAACLLGDRGASLQVLAAAAQQPDDALAGRARALALIASPFDAARKLARRLSAKAAGQPRRVLRIVGLLGDAQFVPWLLERMDDEALARPAAEAISWITGVDLAREGLQLLAAPARPEPSGEDDEASAPALDEDEDLPWPDVAGLRLWWTRRGDLQQAAASGQRLFAGSVVDLGAAQRELLDGTQRMRALAALWRCVLQPGRALFPIAAPAARQQRRLAAAREPAPHRTGA